MTFSDLFCTFFSYAVCGVCCPNVLVVANALMLFLLNKVQSNFWKIDSNTQSKTPKTQQSQFSFRQAASLSASVGGSDLIRSVGLWWGGAGGGRPVLACNQTYLSLWRRSGTSLMKQVKKMFIRKTASWDAGTERHSCHQAVTCLARCPEADAVIDLDVCPAPPAAQMSRCRLSLLTCPSQFRT